MIDDLEALDAAFNAPDSTMHVDTYFARQKEIRARAPQSRKAAPVTAAAAAPAASPDPRPPQVATRTEPLMKASDQVELEAFQKQFREARACDDADAMLTTVQNERFQNLTITAACDQARADVEQKIFNLAAVLAFVAAEQKFVRMLFQTHVARRKKLEARLSALEARPAAMSYRGTWSADDHYLESEFCTLSGSLWACRETGTRSRPGSDNSWQLAVKKGRSR